MRFWCYILSFYLLALTAVPCVDGLHSSAEHKGQNVPTLEQAAATAHQQNAAADDCSPFCTCHCCHTHVSFHEHATVSLLILIPQTTLPAYFGFIPDTQHGAVFRPPIA